MRNGNNKGFSLIEMLLVLVIASSIVLMIVSYTTQKADELRRDRTSMQLQEILNAALSYYVNNAVWPSDAVGNFPAALVPNYLPSSTMKNPWGNGFVIAAYPGTFTNLNSPMFSISTTLPNATEAKIVAGRVPFGVVNTNTVTVSVSAPVQSLNNDRSVNFAQVYNSGACVPQPTCPLNMTATIFVVPVQVYGTYDPPAGGIQNIRPITGYTAYATAAAANPNVPSCKFPTSAEACLSAVGTNMPNAATPLYYRVCLRVETEQGPVTPTTNTWGNNQGSILAITRCMPNGEYQGTPFNVWSQ